MTTLSIRKFNGMIPRLPPERLPDGAAEYAKNCDFSYGELRSLKGPGATKAVTRAVRSLFTDNGSRFFTWDVPTRAYLAPTIDDTWGRVYYNSEGQGLRVAQKSLMLTTNPQGPTTSYKVGVKPPSTGGSVKIKGGANYRVMAQLIVDGAVFREEDVTNTVTVLEEWALYRVAVPAGFTATIMEAQPISPSVSGWITVPKDASGTWIDPASNVEMSGNVVGGAWEINENGHVRVGGLTYDTVQQVLYNGKTYAPASTLFAALENGEAAKDGTSVSLRFSTTLWRVLDGSVFFDGFMPHADGDAPNTYKLTVPDFVKGDLVTVAVLATAVNAIGEESIPYGPEILEYRNNGTEVLELQVSYTQDPDEVPVSGINFYRTYPGFSNTDYFLINSTPITFAGGTSTYTDNTTTPWTTTTLQTADWDRPPSDLKYLTYAGNGAFCGASGKDLCFSEPFRPHAWPYRMLFPHDIVGIVEVEGGVLVTTTAQPYFVYGSHPEQMTQQALNAEQAGVGYRSMARLSGSAVYASNDGLVMASGGQASIKESQQLFTRNNWRDAYKAHFDKLALSAWDGALIGVVDGVSGSNFIMRLDESPSYALLDVPGKTIHGVGISQTTDQMGLLFNDGFAEFGVGAALSLEWKSRIHEFPMPVSFGACIVRHDGSFSVEFHKDGSLIHTQAITGSAESAFRLPSAGSGKRWQVRITGTGTVKSVELGASFAELKNG